MTIFDRIQSLNDKEDFEMLTKLFLKKGKLTFLVSYKCISNSLHPFLFISQFHQFFKLNYITLIKYFFKKNKIFKNYTKSIINFNFLTYQYDEKIYCKILVKILIV